MTIDTLEYVKRLEAAGVDRKQAEAQAAAMRDTLAPQLATKSDIDRFREATKSDIDRLREATKVDIDRLKEATKADLDTAVVRLEAKIDGLRSQFEMALGKHTAGIYRHSHRCRWRAAALPALGRR